MNILQASTQRPPSASASTRPTPSTRRRSSVATATPTRNTASTACAPRRVERNCSANGAQHYRRLLGPTASMRTAWSAPLRVAETFGERRERCAYQGWSEPSAASAAATPSATHRPALSGSGRARMPICSVCRRWPAPRQSMPSPFARRTFCRSSDPGEASPIRARGAWRASAGPRPRSRRCACWPTAQLGPGVQSDQLLLPSTAGGCRRFSAKSATPWRSAITMCCPRRGRIGHQRGRGQGTSRHFLPRELEYRMTFQPGRAPGWAFTWRTGRGADQAVRGQLGRLSRQPNSTRPACTATCWPSPDEPPDRAWHLWQALRLLLKRTPIFSSQRRDGERAAPIWSPAMKSLDLPPRKPACAPATVLAPACSNVPCCASWQLRHGQLAIIGWRGGTFGGPVLHAEIQGTGRRRLGDGRRQRLDRRWRGLSTATGPRRT